jgi:hypothetical protein
MRRCGEFLGTQAIDKRVGAQGRTHSKLPVSCSSKSTKLPNLFPQQQTHFALLPYIHNQSAHHGPHTLHHHRRKAQPLGPPNRQENTNRPRHRVHLQKPSHRHHDHHQEDHNPPQRRRPPWPRRQGPPGRHEDHRRPRHWCPPRPCDHEPYQGNNWNSAPQADHGRQSQRNSDQSQGEFDGEAGC